MIFINHPVHNKLETPVFTYIKDSVFTYIKKDIDKEIYNYNKTQDKNYHDPDMTEADMNPCIDIDSSKLNDLINEFGKPCVTKDEVSKLYNDIVEYMSYVGMLADDFGFRDFSVFLYIICYNIGVDKINAKSKDITLEPIYTNEQMFKSAWAYLECEYYGDLNKYYKAP